MRLERNVVFKNLNSNKEIILGLSLNVELPEFDIENWDEEVLARDEELLELAIQETAVKEFKKLLHVDLDDWTICDY